MRFENTMEVEAPIERVRAAIRNIEGLGACIPGCQQISAVEDGKKYSAIVRERLGPFQVEFVLDVHVEAGSDPDTLSLRIEGRDTRLGSRLSQSVEISVRELSPVRTRLDMVTDVSIFGKLATLGKPIVERKAGEITRAFARNFQAWLGADAGEAQGGSATSA